MRDAIDEQPFWMVYGNYRGPPTFKHMTREGAETEAKRLARMDPDTKFYVLETVSVAEKIDVRVTRIMRRDTDDGIPF